MKSEENQADEEYEERVKEENEATPGAILLEFK